MSGKRRGRVLKNNLPPGEQYGPFHPEDCPPGEFDEWPRAFIECGVEHLEEIANISKVAGYASRWRRHVDLHEMRQIANRRLDELLRKEKVFDKYNKDWAKKSKGK